MNLKEIAQRINSVTLKGKTYERLLSSRDIKLSWFEKLRKFKHTADTLAFPNHYLYSVKRKNQVIDVYDLPLSSICKELTLSIIKEKVTLVPKCSCGRDLIVLTFIKRIGETYPIWFCPHCSEISRYRPCKIHFDSSLKLSEKEISEVKEVLKKIRDEDFLRTEEEKEKELEDFIVLIDEDNEEE